MVAIRVYEWKPAGPNVLWKSFGLRQSVRTVSVTTDAASAIRSQFETCVEKGHFAPEVLAELNSGIRADRFQHLLGELRRSGFAKAYGREESQEFVEESDAGRDEEEAEARDGAEGDEDATIAAAAHRRGRKMRRRQPPHAEADEFTSDEHLPGKMGGTRVARSWHEYASGYFQARGGSSLRKSMAECELAGRELDQILEQIELS
jgi:hypothetical protein